MLTIRPHEERDWPSVWSLFRAVCASGEVFAYDDTCSEATARALWVESPSRGFVAYTGERFVGTYFVRPNQPGRGSHVANGGYMVAPDAAGQGVATAMCLHSIEAARELGFRAMQFNFVVSTNLPAIRVWEKCGFAVVGRLPGAYLHREAGYVDALVYFRHL
jgi:RimJ/RimL family protein N-acetyltransferase